MFCSNCGTKLEDDAVFCYNCGNKTSEETVSVVEPVVQPTVQPVVARVEPVAETMASAYEQPTFNQNVYQPQQVAPIQPMNQVPLGKVKGSKATVPAVIFAILSIIASSTIAASCFVKGDVGNAIDNILYAIASITIVAFAVSVSRGSSIAKGIISLALTVCHVIFYGIAGFKTVFTTLGDSKNGTDYYYLIILLASLVFFYLYMLINIIRCFAGKNKASFAMLLFAYLAVVLIVAMTVINIVSGYNEFIALKFIPTDLGIITMILADIFAVIARGKKAE